MLNEDPITDKEDMKYIIKSENEFREVLPQKEMEEDERVKATIPNI